MISDGPAEHGVVLEQGEILDIRRIEAKRFNQVIGGGLAVIGLPLEPNESRSRLVLWEVDGAVVSRARPGSDVVLESLADELVDMPIQLLIY